MTLRQNVLPSLIMHNVSNGSAVYAKGASKPPVCGLPLSVEGANFAYFLLRKFGAGAAFATGYPFGMQSQPVAITNSRAPFTFSVVRVFCARAEKEVSKIDAIGNVAVVAHKQPVRDRPQDKLPYNAVGLRQQVSFFFDPPVTLAAMAACPQPTPFRAGAHINSDPEAFCERACGDPLIIAGMTTKSALPVNHGASSGHKVIPARLANALDHSILHKKGGPAVQASLVEGVGGTLGP